MWGDAQAERYLLFLEITFHELADDPSQGMEIEGRPGIYLYTARYRKGKNAPGHRIFYRTVHGGIEIYRVLHTAMQWPDHLF